MLRRTLLALTAASAALAFTAPTAFAEGKTFYWISHGGPADPVWTYFLQGAELWAADTGNTVNTSFFSGDVAAQQRRSAPLSPQVPTASSPPAPTPAASSTSSTK